jgi:ribosome maturation factor RimP
MGPGEQHAELLQRLHRLAGRVAEKCGLEVVELELRGSGRRRLLRIDVDRPGPSGVGLEDCRRVSEAIGGELESDDLIPGSYVLEVSSPGVDRPIRSADDIRRNTGRRIVIETAEPIDGERQFRGVLLGAEHDELRVQSEGGNEVRIALRHVAHAKQDVGF